MSFWSRRPLCNNNISSAPIIKGKPFVLCWRCCGATVGAFCILILNKVGIINCVLNGWIIVSAIPSIIDYMLNRIKLKRASNILRFLTGIMLGYSVAYLEIVLIK